MHKDDLMTPVERANALAKGLEVDRMPISMFYGAPAHTLLGWTRPQSADSGRAIATVQEKVYATFGCDSVGAEYGLHSLAISFGAEFSDDPHIPVSIIKNPIPDIDDLSALDLENATVKNNEKATKCYEAVHILSDELGDEVPCGMGFPGIITAASGLVGVPQLLKAMLRKPEQVYKLLDFTLQALLQMAEPFIKEGYGIMVSDPVASGTIFSIKQFREFAKPYCTRFVDGCKSFNRDVAVSCHICGDTTPVLDDIADCGYSVFSLDNLVDLAVAKERIGSRIHLLGNVNPSDILYRGTPEMVREAVRQCFIKAGDNPGGYTIGTGCDMVYGTPIENAFAFVAEARNQARTQPRPSQLK